MMSDGGMIKTRGGEIVEIVICSDKRAARLI